MKKRSIILLFSIIIVTILIGLYLFLWYFLLDEPIKLKTFHNIMQSRIPRLIAMIVVAILISVVSLVFQTITQNRILTPSMLGFDATFLTTQLILTIMVSTSSILITNPYINFLCSTLVMVIVAFFMYATILKKHRNNLMFLLLAGIIIAQMLGSFNTFLQYVITPEAYVSVVSRTMVSINNANVKLIWVSLPLMAILFVLFYRKRRIYDVMLLGEEQAIGLGIDYHKEIKRNLVYISFAMAITTALIGPMSFLGLIAVNAAREMLKNFRHGRLMFVSALLGIIVLVGGQLLVETLSYKAPLMVIINLIGGVYVIYLVLKENKV